jgi:hypothetical protein
VLRAREGAVVVVVVVVIVPVAAVVVVVPVAAVTVIVIPTRHSSSSFAVPPSLCLVRSLFVRLFVLPAPVRRGLFRRPIVVGQFAPTIHLTSSGS